MSRPLEKAKGFKEPMLSEATMSISIASPDMWQRAKDQAIA